jgi:hypothetical protein
LLATALGAAAAAAAVPGRDDLVRKRREAAAGRFVLTHGPGDLLRRPAASGATLRALAALTARRTGATANAGWFADDLFLCRHPELGRGDGRRVWAFAGGDFTEVTRRLPDLRRRACGRIRRGAPLTATFRFAEGRLAWELGPHADGTWAFVFEGGVDRVEVPARAAMWMGARRGASLQVRLEAPAGWVAYSEPLALDFGASGRALVWSRP